MEEAKTFEQMLKAYKAIRKQIMDAKLDDITAVEITEYNDPSRYHSWININIHFGKDMGETGLSSWMTPESITPAPGCCGRLSTL